MWILLLRHFTTKKKNASNKGRLVLVLSFIKKIK